jgi:methionine biosynthesis protein MetW
VSPTETVNDQGDPNNSQTQLITLVGRDQTVLDVGCGAGEVAEALAARGCTVSGVDIDAESAEPARAVLDELVVADIDRDPLSGHFKAESFDAILFGEVLQHLQDPQAALRDATTLLRPGGRILVSVPNVAHAAVRLALLQGRWAHADQALHALPVRYFTLQTLCDLLESAGLGIELLRSTVLDPLAAREVTLDADRLPPAVVEWVRQEPSALDHHYVVVARALAPGQQPGPRPVLEPAISYDAARLRDKHTEKARAELEERHRMLTVRDHVIGLEASAVAAQGRTARMRSRAKGAERRYRRVRNELDAVTGEIEQIAQSRRPRTHLRGLAERLRAEAAKRAKEGPTDAGDDG